jgi:hypothetical protein
MPSGNSTKPLPPPREPTLRKRTVAQKLRDENNVENLPVKKRTNPVTQNRSPIVTIEDVIDEEVTHVLDPPKTPTTILEPSDSENDCDGVNTIEVSSGEEGDEEETANEELGQ